MKKIVLYSAIFLIAVVVILKIGVRKKEAPLPVARDTRVAETSNLKGELDIRSAFIKVADEAGKAIVTISTERTQKVRLRRPGFGSRRFGSPFGGGEDPFEKFFEDFFGRSPEREFKQRGLGSGFIIDKQGHILTNYHVIEGADKINITLPDGRNFVGTVQGMDPRSDLAIVKIKAKNLPTVMLGDSDLLQVGEWVVALGNPFGHVLKSPKPTVTVGVVSALHRQIPAPGGERGYLDMVQTDAAINPGNSGGPLCDINGKVIGINVVIFSTSGGYQGVGFAIPVNHAKNILNDLIKGIEVAYGWLGVSAQEITPAIAEYFNLPDRKGALIAEVLPDSPAEKAGLKEGDIVTGINKKPVDTLHDLLRVVGNIKVGQTVSVEIIRDKVKKGVTVKVGKRPTKAPVTEGKEFKPPKESEKWRGIKVTGITDEIAKDLGLEDREGVVVVEIEPGSLAHAAGLKRGDVMREINKIRVKNLGDYKKVTKAAKGIVLVRTDRGYFAVKESEPR